jgi:type VI protein secretion system component VasK
MGASPEELRREIEETRRDLTYDVDALNEKVSPSRVMARRVDRTRGAVSSLKERVMGSAKSGTSSMSDTTSSAASSASGAMSSAASTVSDAASSVSGAVSQSPQMARERAQGNPLAAGLVAFAGGWLISSMLPATQREEQLAETIQDKAAEYKEPLKQQAQQVAQELKENLQEPAQQAVQQVKDSATDAASTVKEEGQSQAQTVTEEAKSSAQNVQSSRGGSS